MAITNTSKSKEFMAGASPIILKGDLRLKASVDNPFYRDDEGDRDEHSYRMFNKPYKELNEGELEDFRLEMMRLMNKFSSAPVPMDERNSMMESLSLRYYGKPLKDLTEDEIIDLEEAFDDLTTKKNAPSMMMAADGGRAQYGLGSLVKSIKKTAKKVDPNYKAQKASGYTRIERQKIARAAKRLTRDMRKGVNKPASHYDPKV